jgi:hypothetical protein
MAAFAFIGRFPFATYYLDIPFENEFSLNEETGNALLRVFKKNVKEINDMTKAGKNIELVPIVIPEFLIPEHGVISKLVTPVYKVKPSARAHRYFNENYRKITSKKHKSTHSAKSEEEYSQTT